MLRMRHRVRESGRFAMALSVGRVAAAARLAPGLLCTGLALALLRLPTG